MRWRRWGGALALVAASLAPGAAAHQGDPNVVVRLDEVAPPIGGVTVDVRLGSAAQLFLVNDTRTPVEVIDTEGRPFLRIGPRGVRADVGSPDWPGSTAPLGAPPAPRTAVTWQVVGTTNSWAWYDHRMHPADERRPSGAKAAARVAEWTVPLRHGGREHVVRGHVAYKPFRGALRMRVERKPATADVDVLDGRVPGLSVTWRGSGTLTLRGSAGEPLARLTPGGAEVNEASDTWQQDQRLRGRQPAMPPDPERPVWRRAGDAPSLSWLDARLGYPQGEPPRDVAGARVPTVLREWDVAADVDGRPAHIRGVTEWVPDASRLDRRALVFPVAAAGAALALVLLALALRRRSRLS